MVEINTDRNFGRVPAPLNDLQVQALKNELFGHPSTRDWYTIPLKPPTRMGASPAKILEFQPRPTNK